MPSADDSSQEKQVPSQNEKKLKNLKKAADDAGAAVFCMARDVRKRIRSAEQNGEDIPISINDMKSFSVTLKNLTGVTRDLYDIPTAAEVQKMNIDRIRYEEKEAGESAGFIITGATDEEVDEWSE